MYRPHCWNFIWVLLLSLAVIAPVGAQVANDAQLQQQLAPLIHRYRTSNDTRQKLTLAYQALQKYGHVQLKTQLPNGFRPVLSEMKRQVLFTAMNENSYKNSAIAAGIGSTGMWIRRIEANNYDSNRPDTIAENKLKGMYMEGLSDLDFPIMGSDAIAYEHEIKSILKVGTGRYGLGDDDLERLEISFLVDDQVDEVRSLGDPRRFWNLMLDVEHSSYHQEKYLTKGGKALYCLEHLIGSGATVINGQPVRMSDWAQAEGHQLGPFGIQFLLGGCADMDYFMRHACEKTTQEPAKTMLQLMKYLKRQRWMVSAAMRGERQLARLESAGLSASQVNRLDQQLRSQFQRLNTLVSETTDVKPWNSTAYFETFKAEFRQLSESSCALSHHWILQVGNALLDKVDAGTVTESEVRLLYQIAYDVDIVHNRRYTNYPNESATTPPLWYNREQQAESREFLERFRLGRAIVEETFPEYQLPWRTMITQMEVGPLITPTFANVHIASVTATRDSGNQAARSNNAPQVFEIAIAGSLRGLSPPDRPGTDPWQMPPISRSQMQDMQDLAAELRQVELATLKIEHLLNQQTTLPTETGKEPYVSPFEMLSLVEELRLTNDDIRMRAQRLSPGLDRLLPTQRGGNAAEPGSPVGVTSSLQDIQIYLQGLNSAADQSKKLLTAIQQIANASGNTDIANASGSVLAKLEPLLAQRDRFLQIATDISQVSQGDPGAIGKKTEQLGDYLLKMADAVETAAQQTKQHERSLVASIYRMRRQAWQENADVQQLLSDWESARAGIFQSVSSLLTEASWLRSSGQFAKSAGTVISFGAKLHEKFHSFQATFRKIDDAIVDQGTKEMLFGLKYTGEVMAFVASIIPEATLSYGVELYSRLLREIDDVGIAWYQLQLRKTQGQLAVQYGSEVKAYTGIIRKGEAYGLDEFFLDTGPLASRNRLNQRLVTTTGLAPDAAHLNYPGFANRIWLVISDSIAEEGTGFIELTSKQKIDLCNICAWHWRVYGRAVDREDLADLLMIGETKIDGNSVRLDDLEFMGRAALTRIAWKKYLARFAKLAPRDDDEQRLARELLESATRAFTEKGFLLHREDVYQLLKELRNTERGFAGLGRRQLAMENGQPAVVARLLRAKEKIRHDERKRAWKAALQLGPAGLNLDDVHLKFIESVNGKDAEHFAEFNLKPDRTAFQIKRKISLPPESSGKFAYSGLVWIENHRSTTCDFGTVLNATSSLRPGPPTQITGDPGGQMRGILRGGPDPVKIKEITDYWNKLNWTADFQCPEITFNVETGEVSPRRFVFEAVFESNVGHHEVYRISQTLVGPSVKGAASYFEGQSWTGQRNWELEWFDKQGKRTHHSTGEGEWRAFQKDGVWFLSTVNSVAGIFGDVPFRLKGQLSTTGPGNSQRENRVPLR